MTIANNRNPHFTKAGPGRRTHTKSERAAHFKTAAQKRAGIYGRSLMAYFARRLAAESAERLQRRALR